MDFNTLFAVNIFGLALCSIALIMNAVGARNVRIPAAMVQCSLSGALGMLLMMSYGHVNKILSLLVGSFCLQLTFVFMYSGYSWMVQRPKQSHLMRGWMYLLAETVAGTALLAYFVLYTDEILPRVIIFSVGIILGSVSCIVLLLRVPDVFLREASWLSILCLSVYAVSSAVRMGAAILHPPTEAYLSTAVLQPAFLLVNMIALAGLTYGHIWITGARQRLTLQSQAYTDELTGVLNRRALETEAEREISRSRRNRQPLAVVMCDLDKFKEANDALGHQYGDAYLRAASSAVRMVLRREDQIARLGGDEFVVLLPGTSRERALEVAERLRKEVEMLHVVERGKFREMSASFGVAMLDSVACDTWRALLDRADGALYAAKHLGGNKIIMDPVPEVVVERMEEDRLKAALEVAMPLSKGEVEPGARPGSTTIQ